MTYDPVEILLVEDSPDDVELTLRALRKSRIGNHIKVLGDGVEALEYIRPVMEGSRPDEGTPKLILLDLKLPRMTGLEVLKQLKASPATRPIPVVVLTSSREESDLIESYQLGANSYIVKPLDYAQFVEAIGVLGMYWMVLNKVPA